MAAKRQSFGFVEKVAFAFLKERWVVFLLWGSELQDHPGMLGKPPGKAMSQPAQCGEGKGVPGKRPPSARRG